jgi:hypothetical protein
VFVQLQRDRGAFLELILRKDDDESVRLRERARAAAALL